MGLMVAIRSGGKWLSYEVGPVSGVKIVERRNGGCWSAEWSMLLPETGNDPATRPNQMVEVFVGGQRVHLGNLSEGDGDGGFTSDGWCRLAETYLALDGDGNPTTVPDTAIATATVNSALPWRQFESFATTAVSDAEAQDVNAIGPVLDASALEQGVAWGVDANGRLYKAALPDSPKWVVRTGGVDLTVSDEDYVTDLFIRYLDEGGIERTTLGGVTSGRRFGTRQGYTSLLDLGPISLARAQGIGQQMLAQGGPRPSFGSALAIGDYQLFTAGGTLASHSLVRANDMIRIYGLTGASADLAGGSTLDIVVDELTYEPDTHALTVNPIGRVPRTLSEVLAADNKIYGLVA